MVCSTESDLHLLSIGIFVDKNRYVNTVHLIGVTYSTYGTYSSPICLVSTSKRTLNLSLSSEVLTVMDNTVYVHGLETE